MDGIIGDTGGLEDNASVLKWESRKMPSSSRALRKESQGCGTVALVWPKIGKDHCPCSGQGARRIVRKKTPCLTNRRS